MTHRAAVLTSLIRSALGRHGGRRVVARLAPWLAAGLLLAIAFGFLVASVHLVLLQLVPAPWAALIMALVLAALAGIALLIVRHPSHKAASSAEGEVDDMLRAVGAVVRRSPWSAVAIAVVAGALSEMSPSASSDTKRGG